MSISQWLTVTILLVKKYIISFWSVIFFCVGLLLHLCFFHIYISFLGLTTYEYIRQQRQNQQEQQSQQQRDSTESENTTCSIVRHRPANLSCSERSRTTLFTCAVLEESFSVRFNRYRFFCEYNLILIIIYIYKIASPNKDNFLLN